MTIQQTATTSFKVELLQGVHNFGPTSPDTFKIALYDDAANLGYDTTVYTSDHEVSGAGYSSGGAVLTISQSPVSGVNNASMTTAYVSFENVSWAGALTARGALIYNSSKGNKSVAVLDFGANKTSTTSFVVQFPLADANSAIVRIY